MVADFDDHYAGFVCTLARWPIAHSPLRCPPEVRYVAETIPFASRRVLAYGTLLNIDSRAIRTIPLPGGDQANERVASGTEPK
jgi:hypothetical protein